MVTRNICPFTGDKSLKIYVKVNNLIVIMEYSKVLGYSMMIYDKDEMDVTLIIEDPFISADGISGRVTRDLISDEKRQILSENRDDLIKALEELQKNADKI